MEELQRRRLERLQQLIGMYKKDLAERIGRSKELFRRPVITVDLHTHSCHSDGLAPVAANQDAARAAGIDFLFATDHGSIDQRPEALARPGSSWGQEPGGTPHHLGVLGNQELFKPKGEDFRQDWQAATECGAFAWVPHPAGWYPSKTYSDEQLAALWQIDGFAMEVINGANKVFSGSDRFDARARQEWDRLLTEGRRVTGVGASDAHIPETIGACWTGLIDCSADVDSILAALQAGRCFASEASIVELKVAGQTMGSVVQAESGKGVNVEYTACDAEGLQLIRLISGGEVVLENYPKGETTVQDAMEFIAEKDTYFRLETMAVDGKKAFTSPIYVGLVEGSRT